MIGGMESLSHALATEFSKLVDTTLITWGKSQKYLPLVLPYFLIRAFFLIPTKKIDHLHIGDALLSPLGLLLKIVFNVKTTITVMGLDITFTFPGYQFIIPKCVSKFDKVICISEATREECIKRGIPKEKCIIIPCGVYPDDWRANATRKDLEKIVGTELKDKKVLITVGRLVKRKGVYWFIENVLPYLDKNTIYLVIGDGPEKERIKTLVKSLNLEEQVYLLGKIPDHDLKVIYNTADLFIMPNIKVPGTVEGFGIVAIEASAAGLPVIASDLEGITNAVIEGKTGRLVESLNQKEFSNAIKQLKLNRKEVSKITSDNYSWRVIGKEYVKAFI